MPFSKKNYLANKLLKEAKEKKLEREGDANPRALVINISTFLLLYVSPYSMTTSQFNSGKVGCRNIGKFWGLQTISKMASSGSTHSLFLVDSGSLWSRWSNQCWATCNYSDIKMVLRSRFGAIQKVALYLVLKQSKV